MRNKILGGLAVALLAGVSSTALAAQQNTYTSKTATTTVTNVTVGAPLTVDNVSIGNLISATGNIGYVSTDAQDIASSANIKAQTDLSNVTANTAGASAVNNQAIGNAVQIDVVGSVGNNGQYIPHASTALSLDFTDLSASAANQQINTAGGTAQVNAVANISSSTFGGALDAKSSALGNLLSSESSAGYTTLGDGTTSRVYIQSNVGVETANLNVTNTTVTGKFTGGATAAGNSVNVGSLAAGSNLQQNNNAAQTAQVQLTNVTTSTVANEIGSSAVGNSVGSIAGQAGQFGQSNTASQTATTGLTGGVLNGKFSAQAVGNTLSFDGNTAATKVGQVSNGAQVASLTASGVTFNSPVDTSALAVGNSFSGTNVPGMAQGLYNHQFENTAQTATTSITGSVSNVGLATVGTSAIGNVATLTQAGAFIQAAYGPQVASAGIVGSNFAGGLTVNTAAIGNSLTVK